MTLQNLAPLTHKDKLTNLASLRRILLVGRDSLLQDGLMMLLTHCQDIEVFQSPALAAHELEMLAEQISPDVIVLCHVAPSLPAMLVELLAARPSLHHLLVMDVNLHSTDLRVFQYQQWRQAGQNDFFSLVIGTYVEAPWQASSGC